ncbi:hypothetical protein K435DRAFT_800337 [Dendrothele bispora CBS 962.96]|uniref:Uncharacterized protein n=1 Tax=Dendrothele bispora (strain CBS 962.96) TaxID=1314807 RepID=A0A4V4HEY5_DENBC|nr:hypothetical protein K435DRAFT_800337 [Dendrothele bispora CBS 962.96]
MTSEPSFRQAFYSVTSNLLNLVNNYKSVHTDKRFTGAWREKTGRGPIQTTSRSSDKNKNKKTPPDARSEGRLCVGPGENVEDEPNQVHKELEKKLDRCMEEEDDYSTKEVIELLTYGGVGRLGLLPALRPSFNDLQFQLEFTLHRRIKGSSMCKSLMDLREGGNTCNPELGEGRKKFSW